MASIDAYEANKQVARRFPEEIASKGNFDLIDELCTPDVVDHSPLGDVEGREALKEQMRMLNEAFGDFSATVDDVFAEGDKVAMRLTLRGTHEGEFMGNEPTGKSFEVSNLLITRIEDGRIAERWVSPDMLGMLSQVGVIESPMSP